MTKRDVYCIPAPTSGGTMYCLKGRNKNAKTELAKRYGSPNPGGYHVLSRDQFYALMR